MSLTLSQRLARYICGASYRDLPGPVVDRVKGRLLHGFATALAGFQGPSVQKALKLARAVETAQGGATVLRSGDRVTPLGAAFVNSLSFGARNQSDSYRILTHPSAVVVPAALAAAETAACSGRDFLMAVAAGLEVETRMASSEQSIKAVQHRGFRASCTYGVFGSAAAAGKLLGLSEEQMVHCLGLAATFAGGTAEGQRWGTDETSIQDAQASRNGLWAAFLAREGLLATETALDGEVGFLHAFTGGAVSDTSHVTQDIGQRFELMRITSKSFPAVGFNQLPAMLMTSLARRHNIRPEAVGSITVEMSHDEVFYPSAEFAKHCPVTGLTEYYVATACVLGEFPQVLPDSQIRASAVPGEGDDELADAATQARILEISKKVFVRFSREREIYHPRMTVRLKDGLVVSDEMTPEALYKGLDAEVELLRPLVPLTGLSPTGWRRLVTAVGRTEALSDVSPLVAACVPAKSGEKAKRPAAGGPARRGGRRPGR